jgi:subtilisin family serine protease
MKKILLVSIILLSMLLLAVPPRVISEEAPRSLAFDVAPAKAEFAEEMAIEATGTPIEDPTPFWVDIVDAENYPNGGEGIYVAVLDTGLLANWQFFFTNPVTGECRIKWEWGKGYTHDMWWNDTLGDFEMGPLRDDRGFITDSFKGSGHGTHVTSTIIGYRFLTATADMWIRGVAPKATIIPVLVLDAWEVPYPGGVARFTGGTWEMVSAGIRYVGDLAEREGVKIIISMSLGGTGKSAMIEDAINYAISKGVIVVAAAGNRYEVQMDYPGAYPQVISVAAGGWTEEYITRPPPAPSRWWLNDVPEKLNTKDYWGNNWQTFLEDFSSRPNKDLGQSWKDLDVCAPGAAVVGPYKNYFSTTIGYYLLWGTSMATPHVSAIAAIVAQKYPNIDQLNMEWILKKAAASLPLASDGAFVYEGPYGYYNFVWNDHDYGFGWLQADEALAKASNHIFKKTA